MIKTNNEKACTNFIEGYNACKAGVKHQKGRDADYDRGYSARYTEEQVAGHVWNQ